jgi:hypothetical protein
VWKEVTVAQSGQTRSERSDYDQAIKRLLTRAHDGFLALVAPELTWRDERSPEVPAVARRADLVWEVERPNGARGILHIELQTKVESDIGERLAEYAIRLWRRDHLPIRSLVVFLREAKTIPGSPFVIPWDPEESLRYTFDVVRLWELPQEHVLGTPHYALWPLASLMAQVTAESTLAVAERIVQAPLPDEERRELTGLLLVLAGIRLSPMAVLDVLRRNRMIDDLLKDDSVAQILIEEGERRMAQVALEGRFGTVSEDLLTALRTADEATLRALVSHVATDSLEQVRARLGLT